MSPDTTPAATSSAAAARHRRLGRGLASLVGTMRETEAASAAHAHRVPAAPPADPATAHAAPVEIAVDRIRANPYQPRRAFDDAELAELTDSIRRQGILQPLLVATDGEPGRYTLIAGERRLRAATAAGLQRVPCVVRTATREQMLEWALVENIQRSNLNPVERAEAYRDYMDRFAITQQQLAERLGEARSSVANYLRLLDLCDEARALLLAGQLSFGHAKVLASLAGQAKRQAELARKVVAESLSVRALEQLLGAPAAPTADAPAKPARAPKSQHILDLERQLARAVGTKVVIRPRRKDSGRIVIDYYGLDDFDRIVEALGARLER